MINMINYELYLVTDQFDLEEKDFLTVIEEAILGGTSIVQLREKESSTLDFYNLAHKCKKITDKYDVPLIINDRIDVAMAVNAAGVHLGQSDMPCTIAREIMGPDKIIGISTHTYKQSLKAQEEGADYLGVGAIIPTPTKTDADIAVHEELIKIRDNIDIPTVAIGGINKSNIKKIVNTYNFSGAAVVSAIMLSDNPRKESAKLIKEMKK